MITYGTQHSSHVCIDTLYVTGFHKHKNTSCFIL
uniref:Uncharacterized protein n=1 Tax=Arundo donax TaxID=35708 RepID=A0A0A9AHB0_ARUDO